MITAFHVLVFFGVVAGSYVGWCVGNVLLDFIGGAMGLLLGACTGYVLGHVPWWLALWFYAPRLRNKSTAELRALLRSKKVPLNLALLELARRGERIDSELPLVLELLNSPDSLQRALGWGALSSAFPQLASRLVDYRVNDSAEDCQRKTRELARLVAQGDQGGSKTQP